MTDLSKITHFIVDVDGTLTDAGLYFDNNGTEIKKFCTRDYVGVMAAHYIGIKVLIVTGRENPATKRRASEMKVDYVFQHVKDKPGFIKEYMAVHGISRVELGYIGDDLNDYASMKLAGFTACPADACPEIKEMADYISPFYGGTGVLQDVFRYILSKTSKWDGFIEDVISKGY